MNLKLLQAALRCKFFMTSRPSASRQARREMERTLAVAQILEPSEASLRVRVPAMAGIDEEMRDWSLFMVMSHNAIVNRHITRIVSCLARGERFVSDFDMKRDVRPSAAAGIEVIDEFRLSVDDHIHCIDGLPRLRGSRRHRHPMFGEFDAHQWHCMLAFHLMVHRRQADAVACMLGKP